MGKKSVIIGLSVSLAAAAIALFVFRVPSRILGKFKPQTVASVVEEYEKPVLERLQKNFVAAEVDYENIRIAILAFKSERRVEVYARDDQTEQWKKFKTYEFTGFSGEIGPKLKEGDRQIPEGVYTVESLNPNSAYHLSLRVDYPNEFDREKGRSDGRANLGGDIMIHGKSATIGCIPIGDENIEELFVLAAKGYEFGIPVIISPVDLRKETAVPSGVDVGWKDELYDAIREELKKFS